MAGYYIKCINIDQDGAIRSLGVTLSLLGVPIVYQKETVIFLIEHQGKPVHTAHLLDNVWREGKRVRVVDGRFLRVDSSGEKKDDLGDLPPCRGEKVWI